MSPARAERRLAAVLAADMVGYSGLMAADEHGTHARLRTLRSEIIEPVITAHHGRIVKWMGDGLLAEFASAVDAVEAAVALQEAIAEREAQLPESRRISFRVGINLGDILVDDDDIYGGGVNVAARLEALAEPGGICVARSVYNQVKDKVKVDFEPAGEHRVKNIPEPVVVYRVVTGSGRVAGLLGRAGVLRRRWRWLGIAAAAGVVLALVAALWLHPWLQEEHDHLLTTGVPDRPSIAVLPFRNVGGDPEEEYLADGLTDDLITDLSTISGLLTIARNSMFTYKGRPADVRQVARELGVRYVLEGSVRHADGRVRVNAQLVDGATGRHLWADRYDHPYADIFALSDELVEAIVDALSVELTEAERSLVTRLPTRNLEAYDYYLRAEQERHSPDGDIGVFRSLQLYDEAIARDEGFAEAYAGYARAAAYLGLHSQDAYLAGRLARERIYETAGRALALNPQLPRAHAVLAEIQLVDGEHEAALASARRAVEFGPGDAEAHAVLAWVLAHSGEPAAAVEAAQTALRLDPKPPATVLFIAGLAFYLDRRYEQAIEVLRRARSLAPELAEPMAFLAMAYAQAGALEQAGAEADALLASWFPSASLRFYAVMYAHHKRPQDLSFLLDGLGKAGFPEWPFGLEDRPDRRLDEAQLRAVTFGRTWQGRIRDGEPFYLQTSEEGTAVYSSPSSMRTVTLSIREGMLCYRSEDFMLGRQSCGYVYTELDDMQEVDSEYLYVNAFSAMYFSLAQ